MSGTTTNQTASSSHVLGLTFQDIEIGREYKCGMHKLAIQDISRHFGNWQVCFFDAFTQKVSWEQIVAFRELLTTQTFPE